ncbi:MAG TPA: bifunctional 3,4-dihydroxy-2-butanone 4-phosphate synthase/GTP cyclohydrolase II [Sulfurovum sp.]|nr:MAG: bifunctional 3,4-dihydroxy-2-butanone 4-phosphate synthase/GTP cyclohydrolase II [Sulfurovum sp. 35-42-20]OYZ23914.1 MAG: bifunctional 3,4-dihydroxy-2-butanone 4-phosphate synthase/GTP cyclohydrolase II [Sulfurovum sp. 16-42-52]OYZ48057.1 MAG: bifunctional 3,4-dihydroxy-2-butanone 4-phosphate synthase/GTP cyclohydrolase II [Sulfurovum sp. 24-42-9]OZA43827.1 MAG: bifunctional 3,4-dihydroxy-2-butanone 4-phosphate synthase/GTP cyclohydrolase II [Sulfurovum sp. 17-42-90]OZA61140.1 MAG: bifu
MSIEAIQRVEKAIEEIKKGHMVIMMDDEDRENEGDLVYAATFSTPEMVNFMAKEARGLICTPVTKEIAAKLDLIPMVSNNVSNHETAFTVSIDSANASTGISAAERDDCISKLASPQTVASDFVRPGHIFPLIAKDGGVLVRTGHTEGSVDLCKLAGLAPAAVICEIIKDDGTMARMDDLEVFSRKYDLTIVYISDIVEYRLAHEKLVRRTKDDECTFRGVKVDKITYIDHLDREHTVIQFYKTHQTANVKFHNIGSDIGLVLDDKRFNALNNSIEYLKHNGGTLIFLDTKVISHEQAREFGVGAQILKDLGIKNINLLTTNKDTEFVGLGGFGLSVIEKIEII